MQFRGTGKVVAKALYDYGPEELGEFAEAALNALLEGE